MNFSESGGRSPRLSGAEAHDLRGVTEGTGLAQGGEEKPLGKPSSSLPVQPPVQCLLNHKYETTCMEVQAMAPGVLLNPAKCHRMVEVERDLWRSSCPTPLLRHHLCWCSVTLTSGYRAILAEPKNKSSESFEHDFYSSNMRQEPRGNTLPFCGQPEFCSFEKNESRIQESISKRLSVVSRLPFVQEQLFALFDLVPGLEYCDVQRDPHTNSGYAVIQYSTAASAIYAKYKLHGFEYPPGNRLTVIFLEDGSDSSDLIRKMATQLVTAQVSSVLRSNNTIVQQYRTPPQAFGGTSGSQLLQPQTDAILPPHKKKVPPDTLVKERLFILFHPHPLPVNVLEDVFCRFGHLIKVYLVAGKNVGYAKFADRASASDAITALHGKIVNGVRLKVRLADSPTEESNKRQRTY
ncbi:RNA-binding protein 45 isoform X3 [Tyto alba]|uniref:RNA-binding protein 45 isoform X3 n=1 Tax=Tyto alba TaxID=56313 RepID=UPI001C670081|nr:RNA-binding protein 45 isoform X3 [Tyto alba]